MDRNEWIRDILFYLIALAFLLIFSVSGTITHFKSLIFLLIYLCYIIVIVYQVRTAKLSPEKKRERTLRNEQGKLNSMMKKYMKDNEQTTPYFYTA